jgi:lysyl-tRNA synthetase class I
MRVLVLRGERTSSSVVLVDNGDTFIACANMLEAEEKSERNMEKALDAIPCEENHRGLGMERL